MATAVAQFVEALHYGLKVAVSIPDGASRFVIDFILPAAPWHWGPLSL